MTLQLTNFPREQIQPAINTHLLAGEEVITVQQSETLTQYLTNWWRGWLITIGSVIVMAFIDRHEVWNLALTTLLLLLFLKLMYKSFMDGIPFDVITNKRIIQMYKSGEKISSHSFESLKSVKIQNRIGSSGDLKLTLSLGPKTGNSTFTFRSVIDPDAILENIERGRQHVSFPGPPLLVGNASLFADDEMPAFRTLANSLLMQDEELLVIFREDRNRTLKRIALSKSKSLGIIFGLIGIWLCISFWSNPNTILFGVAYVGISFLIGWIWWTHSGWNKSKIVAYAITNKRLILMSTRGGLSELTDCTAFGDKLGHLSSDVSFETLSAVEIKNRRQDQADLYLHFSKRHQLLSPKTLSFLGITNADVIAKSIQLPTPVTALTLI
jgi:hypothetical protein